jgi:hypothetical protein
MKNWTSQANRSKTPPGIINMSAVNSLPGPTTFCLGYYYKYLKTVARSGLALDYGLDGRWFESRQKLGIFLFTTVSRPTLGPTQPPIQWIPGALSLGVKRPGREANHSPPSSAEVKNAWSCTSTSPSWRGAQLKHNDKFTFTLPCPGKYVN